MENPKFTWPDLLFPSSSNTPANSDLRPATARNLEEIPKLPPNTSFGPFFPFCSPDVIPPVSRMYPTGRSALSQKSWSFFLS